MLNRRILRIKAFKVLYSYAENPSMTLAEAESQLETSCEATRSLYLFMLSIIPFITREAAERIENARKKFNPSEEEKNPNLKFVSNGIAPLLEGDPDLNKLLSRRKLSWEPYDAFIRETYDSMSKKDYFKEYMSEPGSSLTGDASLFIKMFEEEFVDSKELEKILEDMSIWWNDDLAYSLGVCCDTMKSMAKGNRWELPPLYRSDMVPSKSKESDKAFVTKLLRTSYSCYDKYFPLVASSTDQWQEDRLFTTDTVLIIMGLGEAKAFPDMPVRVTINEYVEISKYYSTPKSRSFVNGILDRLIRQLVESGEIVKTGIFD
jgi:N utilization substance protein B